MLEKGRNLALYARRGRNLLDSFFAVLESARNRGVI